MLQGEVGWRWSLDRDDEGFWNCGFDGRAKGFGERRGGVVFWVGDEEKRREELLRRYLICFDGTFPSKLSRLTYIFPF